ncbi:MAG: hypothetical protein KDG58_16370, partial [Anaerolineae bacterium]|nr:hypothetical protein [Anaerolineae bacterium]
MRFAYVVLVVAVLAGLASLGASAASQRDPLTASLDQLTTGVRFDLVRWEIDALTGKVGDLLRNPAAGLSPQEADTLVRDYITAAQRAGQLESEIELIFSDPATTSPDAATAGQRAELA